MKNFYFFLIFFFCCTIASGQSGYGSAFEMKKNIASISGSFEGEVKFFYERILHGRHALEIGVGKKWSDTSDTEINYTSNSIVNRTHPPRFYEGYLFSAAYKCYLTEALHPWYVSAFFLYKIYSHPTITVSFLDNGSEVRKGSKDVRAAKLLFGKRFNFPIGNKVSAVMDLNFGLGVREKDYTDAIYYSHDGYNAQSFDPPDMVNKKFVVPSFELGAKLGIGF
jgi:hypothetical protein